MADINIRDLNPEDRNFYRACHFLLIFGTSKLNVARKYKIKAKELEEWMRKRLPEVDQLLYQQLKNKNKIK